MNICSFGPQNDEMFFVFFSVHSHKQGSIMKCMGLQRGELFRLPLEGVADKLLRFTVFIIIIYKIYIYKIKA
jgi:hypothetical protein